MAVDWFLKGKITFTDISGLVNRALDSNVNHAMLDTLEDVIALDNDVRQFLDAGN